MGEDPLQSGSVPLRAMPTLAPPTRLDALIFNLKVSALRAQRIACDVRWPLPRLRRADTSDNLRVVAQASTSLWSDVRPAERAMQRGKVHNLRLAARRLDGLYLPAGAVFSFWKAVGPPLRARGFVAGRMLQEGCLVASPGGGLCQLSNALYSAALDAGCEIIERHAHSRIVPGSLAQYGRDATVAWNYVDLRFRSSRALTLKVQLTARELDVALLAADERAVQEVIPTVNAPRPRANDCGSCGEATCFRHGQGATTAEGVAAFVLDDVSPEFNAYLASVRAAGDRYCLPMDGVCWRRANYAWDTTGFETITAPVSTLRRAVASRRLAAQGPARQTQLLADADRMAAALARALDADVTELYVAQGYLPYLWREGHLGGRRVHVLMNRLPLHVLHARLDAAAQQFPDRMTLADFRADDARVEAEREALAAADTIITPHRDIAALFEGRAVVVDWMAPRAVPRNGTPARRILFSGPVVARKGAFEVREAARSLGLEVVVMGSDLEGAGFWGDVEVRKPAGDTFAGIAAVVQPAVIEERPRRLLAALAAGIPVIATPACGLPPQPGLTLVEPGDGDALIRALERILPA